MNQVIWVGLVNEMPVRIVQISEHDCLVEGQSVARTEEPVWEAIDNDATAAQAYLQAFLEGRAPKSQHPGSVQEQLYRLANTANNLGLYDAADWVMNHLQAHPFKYFKHPGLGVIGTTTGHRDGSYTLLPGLARSHSWIRSRDLYDTREAAEANPEAVFAD